MQFRKFISKMKKNCNDKSEHHKFFTEASIECLLIDYRLDVRTASLLKIPENACFPLFRIEKFNKKRKQLNAGLKKTSICLNYENCDILNIREIESQTYTSIPFLAFELDKKLILDYDIETYNKSFIEKSIEDMVFKIFFKEKSEENSYWLGQFISCLNKLSENSIRYFFVQASNETKFKDFLLSIKRVLKLDDEKLRIFDLLIVKSTKNDSEVDLEKIIKLAQIKQKDVRFEVSKENKKAALDRFKRVSRFIMCNREWVKQFNKKKVEENEKVMLEKYENDFLDCKKIGLLFNKEEFRAQKSLNNLINDFHKNILIIPSQSRTKDQIDSLIELVMNTNL
jgi:hypothetical protein